MSTEVVNEILAKLRRHRLVLVAGPPGVGKSRLLAQVRTAFETSLPVLPAYQPNDRTEPFPDRTVPVEDSANWFPSPERVNRKVFITTFHPNYRYRDFVRGVAPKIGAVEGFMVTSGQLYKAALHASGDDGAALLIIDEINRGPAVQIFGDTIVAIEADKRRGQPNAMPFQILDDSGELVDFELPPDLYILAAMNQADTSVEALDVAFLRRWEQVALDPDESLLRQHFGLAEGGLEIPDVPQTAIDVYTAAVGAWAKVNERISLGRGPEFRIGHGVFALDEDPPDGVDDSIRFVTDSWHRIRGHIAEVFFGSVTGVAAVLNTGAASNPIKLEEASFGGMPVARLKGEETASLYDLLRAVATADAE